MLYECENMIEIRLCSHLFCIGSQFIQIFLYSFPFTSVIHDFHIRLKRNTDGAISGAGIAYLSVAFDDTSGFQYNSCCAVLLFICSVLSFCPLSFNNCIVCLSIYLFCLLLWYLQLFLIDTVLINVSKLSSFLWQPVVYYSCDTKLFTLVLHV